MRNFVVIIPLALCCFVSGEDHYHKASGNILSRDENIASDEADPEMWRRDAAEGIARKLLLRRGEAHGGVARNVVLFLGDGMSVPTVAAARTLLGGERAHLSFEDFPTLGLAKTYCVDSQVADSACSASAYLCGVKANLGTIGVTAAVPRRNCTAAEVSHYRLDSIASWALADGRDAGIVTTTRVTHASPAGAFARTAERNWESDADVRADCSADAQPDIAHQLVHSHPGSQFKVILGGGRREFLPNDTRDEEGDFGRRMDGRDLIAEWADGKRRLGATHRYVWNRSELLEATSEPPEYLLGLFESSHMQYHLEADERTEPTLAELTAAAIAVLSRNPRGFFLFVEGGRIDHAHHENHARLALDETVELAAAVGRAVELLDPADSLLVVTADHAHVMAYSGYAPRGADILGQTGDIAEDGLPYMTLSYTNGPGARPRADFAQEPDYGTARWRAPADVPLDSETHGGDDVAVFAAGPHHALLGGLYEQSHIPHLLAFAACLGRGHTACNTPRPLHPKSRLDRGRK